MASRSSKVMCESRPYDSHYDPVFTTSTPSRQLTASTSNIYNDSRVAPIDDATIVTVSYSAFTVI